MSALHEQTNDAAQSAELTVAAARQAHRIAACVDHGPLELLLREALGDAVRVAQRLQVLASLSTPETGALPEAARLALVDSRQALQAIPGQAGTLALIDRALS